MDTMLREMIYRLARKVEPSVEEELNATPSKVDFYSQDKRLRVINTDGFITLNMSVRNQQQRVTLWTFEFMPVASTWVVIGMIHENPLAVGHMDEAMELRKFEEFVQDFETGSVSVRPNVAIY